MSDAPAACRDTLVANVIAAVLGVAAFAVSFTHVAHVAAGAGQTGWVSYGLAASVELLALAAVAEIRRRSRRGERAYWPRCVLVLGVVMTLAANVATAKPSGWGYIMAAWPAVAFLAVAGIVESRPLRADRVTADPELPMVPQPRERFVMREDEFTALTVPVRADASGASEVDLPVDVPEPGPAKGSTAGEPEAVPMPTWAGQPSRDEVVTWLIAAMRAQAGWRPNYGELMERTGYGRSWCEKRVAQARTALTAGYVEPPTRQRPSQLTNRHGGPDSAFPRGSRE